VLTEGAPSVVL